MSTAGKVLAAVVLGPIVLLVAGIGGCEATKAYYDWKVREMCEKDGGATVYERMAISSELFNKLHGNLGGGLAVPHESEIDSTVPFYWRSEDRRIREGDPSITRTETWFIRRVDRKTLARSVDYARSGGDFPFSGSHPSSFACPTRSVALSREIFFVEVNK